MSHGEDLYRSFRPRAARWVAGVLAVVVLVFMVTLAAALPLIAGDAVGVPDRVGMVLFGLGVSWFLTRQAGVRADPDPTGLVVRNLLMTRRVEWTEIVSVRFGQGRPWVQLDLADGDTLSVMGVQSSDGALAQAEAVRLSTLVARHSTAPSGD